MVTLARAFEGSPRSDESFDVVVIGAGITGVNVARELTVAGASVLLVDKGDLGGGTSSATTKYLHGGIRYLEQREFGVVRESLRERRIYSLAAPHLVSPTRFLMPAWRWSKPPVWLLGAGVGAYSALSYDKNWKVPEHLRTPRSRWLSKKQVLRSVPWLLGEQLQGAFAYHDVLNIHPERLLLALAADAHARGAHIANHTKAIGFSVEAASDGTVTVTGVELRDELTGAVRHVRAALVINAAGPWMDLVLAELGASADRLRVGVQRSKGVHLLTRALGGTDAVLARAPSGHHVVVSPWMGSTYIGPTDTPMDANPDDVTADETDQELILDTVNATIGPAESRLAEADIESVSVGIRPLVVNTGRSSYTASRRHEFYDHRQTGVAGMWSIGGGKWTTARALGEDLVDVLRAEPLLAGRLGAKAERHSPTRTMPVFGSFGWASDPEPFFIAAEHAVPTAVVPSATRRHLARLYGVEYAKVLALAAANPALATPLSARPGCLDIAAQVVHAITDESARTLADVLHRRLVLGTLGGLTRDEVDGVATVLADHRLIDELALREQVALEHRRIDAFEAIRRRQTDIRVRRP